jgi:molybdopterin converting factor small subunit
MPILKIPTPLRPYAGGNAQLDLLSQDVSGALSELLAAHPELKPHLFTETGELRAFVNLFINDQNVRDLQGQATPLQPEDTLMILPSIAGGAPLSHVDHAALRTNQAFIIALSLVAFIADIPWLAGAVGFAMLVGSLLKVPAFGFVYYRWLKPRGLIRPQVVMDNPEPHRFAQSFGAVVQLIGFAFLLADSSNIGWALVWLVIFLAALNLFVGFCAGCAVYFWLHRLGLPGFGKAPPSGTYPGLRPKASR